MRSRLDLKNVTVEGNAGLLKGIWFLVVVWSAVWIGRDERKRKEINGGGVIKILNDPARLVISNQHQIPIRILIGISVTQQLSK